MIKKIKMKKIYLLTLCSFTFTLFSQTVEFEKDNFPSKKEELKIARKQLDVGIEFYGQAREEFNDFKKQRMYKRLVHKDSGNFDKWS